MSQLSVAQCVLTDPPSVKPEETDSDQDQNISRKVDLLLPANSSASQKQGGGERGERERSTLLLLMLPAALNNLHTCPSTNRHRSVICTDTDAAVCRLLSQLHPLTMTAPGVSAVTRGTCAHR